MLKNGSFTQNILAKNQESQDPITNLTPKSKNSNTMDKNDSSVKQSAPNY